MRWLPPLLLLLPLTVSGIEPSLVAPTGPEVVSALDSQGQRERRVAALQEATARLHNAWARAGWMEGKTPLCEDPQAMSLAARARLFGAALREATQSARVHQDRLEHMASSQSVAALIDKDSQDRIQALRAAVERHATVYRELVAWQARFVEPRLKTCTLTLSEAAGITSQSQAAPGLVAIAAIGGGQVCPGAWPAQGEVILVPEGRACYSAGACDCEPELVAPGGVLGPGQPVEPPAVAAALLLPPDRAEPDEEIFMPSVPDAEGTLPGLYAGPAAEELPVLVPP